MKRHAWFLLWLVCGFVGTAQSQTCLITNPAQPFSASASRTTNSVTLTWSPTCTNYAFGIFSTDQLTNNAVWQPRAGMWGSPGGVSQWSDAGVTNRQRFYRVLRTQPTTTSDWNGDGIPDVWDLSYGLNPFDPGDATNDLDGDGYSNWDEFLMGSNPTNSNDPVTVYVDVANTSGTYDGSQANPFQNIQDAIESSVPLTSNLAIRVRPGTNYVTVSNLQYDPSTGNLLGSRQYLYIYAANQDWSLSTDPESHVIDALAMTHEDLLDLSSTSAPTVEFNGVARARINGFKIRGGQGIYAGGIFASSINNGPIYISNCIIEKNGSAGTVAGGIYIQAATNSLIYNTVVAENVGQVGGIYDVNGVQIWNCTIVSNTTGNATYGAVTGGSGAPNVRNSIIWSNGTGAIDLYYANADYSTFGSNEFVTAGLHNLSVDPILVNMLFGNYRLQTNTTVRGAGTPLPLEPRDLYGNPRPVTGRFDVGANQYTDSLGDGIQDDWKIKHGLSLTVSQASLDPDGDGVNNLQEYNQNTDPHNPDTAGDGISDGPTVPLGSGLSPGPSADPTTPDVSLNTIFWDYLFASEFEAYIDSIPHPELVNEPITRAKAIVLNSYHIGDQVGFQWQYLGGTGYYPIITFYVPQTTKGSIIPTPDDIPIDQFVIGGNGFVPATEWRITISEIKATGTITCQGFDDESMQFPFAYGLRTPALSVPQLGTNTFTVPINPSTVVPQISFQIANTNLASVSPTTPSSATQLVSVVGLATGNTITNTQLAALGIGAQSSFTTICSQVAIDILPKWTNATVAIWAVTAKGEPSTTPTNVPDASTLKSYLDSVFGKQANVFMNVLPLVSTNINYDLNTNGILDVATQSGTNLGPEVAAITSAAFRNGAFNVYFVRSNSYALGFADPARSNAFVQDFHPGESSVNLAAHEIGHLLGLPDVGGTGQPPGSIDRLMGPFSGDPCRLIRYEWQTINTNAAKFH